MAAFDFGVAQMPKTFIKQQTPFFWMVHEPFWCQMQDRKLKTDRTTKLPAFFAEHKENHEACWTHCSKHKPWPSPSWNRWLHKPDMLMHFTQTLQIPYSSLFSSLLTAVHFSQLIQRTLTFYPHCSWSSVVHAVRWCTAPSHPGGINSS